MSKTNKRPFLTMFAAFGAVVSPVAARAQNTAASAAPAEAATAPGTFSAEIDWYDAGSHQRTGHLHLVNIKDPDLAGLTAPLVAFARQNQLGALDITSAAVKDAAGYTVVNNVCRPVAQGGQADGDTVTCEQIDFVRMQNQACNKGATTTHDKRTGNEIYQCKSDYVWQRRTMAQIAQDLGPTNLAAIQRATSKPSPAAP